MWYFKWRQLGYNNVGRTFGRPRRSSVPTLDLLPACPPPGGGGLASMVSVFKFSQWLRLAFISFVWCLLYNTKTRTQLAQRRLGVSMSGPLAPRSCWGSCDCSGLDSSSFHLPCLFVGGGGSGSVTYLLELAHPVHLHDLGAPRFLSFVLPLLIRGARWRAA